jgi:hypothetical protein
MYSFYAFIIQLLKMLADNNHSSTPMKNQAGQTLTLNVYLRNNQRRAIIVQLPSQTNASYVAKIAAHHFAIQ